MNSGIKKAESNIMIGFFEFGSNGIDGYSDRPDDPLSRNHMKLARKSIPGAKVRRSTKRKQVKPGMIGKHYERVAGDSRCMYERDTIGNNGTSQ